MMSETTETGFIPAESAAYAPAFHEILDFMIFADSDSDLLPLAQYVRSRIKKGEFEIPETDPVIAAMTRTRPGTVQNALMEMLTWYMDARPEQFNRLVLAE